MFLPVKIICYEIFIKMGDLDIGLPEVLFN